MAATDAAVTTRWNSLEQIARTLSAVAVPFVLAIFGWVIQSSLANRNAAQEYVKLAVSILTQPEQKTDPELRSWAVDLLNANAPTPLNRKVSAQLKTGESELPFADEMSLDDRERWTRSWLGRAGSKLVDLKRELAKRGLYDGPIDDVFDQKLVDSVRAFQSREKLLRDGICGRDCMTKLALPGAGEGG